MAIGSGLSAQLGMAPETVYGTGVTPTLFIEYDSHSLKPTPGTLETRGSAQITLRSGRFRRYSVSSGGQISFDFMQRSMGKILKQMFGTVVGPTQVGVTEEYTQVHTPALSTGRAGVSATWQAGMPQTDGTVKPFTYAGAKVTAWELKQDVDQNLKVTLTLDTVPTVDTATALAAASYAADLTPLAFIDATVTINAVSVALKSLTLNHTAALDLSRRFLGNTKKEPLANGEWVFGGSLDKEFEDTDIYDDFIAGNTAALVATWAYGEIGTTGNPFKLVVTIPELRYDEGMPALNGSEILTQTVPFKALNNGTDAIITAEYHTDDTAL